LERDYGLFDRNWVASLGDSLDPAWIFFYHDAFSQFALLHLVAVLVVFWVFPDYAISHDWKLEIFGYFVLVFIFSEVYDIRS